MIKYLLILAAISAQLFLFVSPMQFVQDDDEGQSAYQNIEPPPLPVRNNRPVHEQPVSRQRTVLVPSEDDPPAPHPKSPAAVPLRHGQDDRGGTHQQQQQHSKGFEWLLKEFTQTKGAYLVGKAGRQRATTEPQLRSPAAEWFVQVLRLLVKSNIINPRMATDLSITFGIRVPNLFVTHYAGKPLTLPSIASMQNPGDHNAHVRFKYGLSTLIESGKQKDLHALANLLVYMALDNKLMRSDEIKVIAAKYGMTVPERGVGSILSAITGDSTAAKKFLSSIVKLLNDKPIQTAQNTGQQTQAINLVLDLLIDNEILDAAAAAKLALVVGIGGRPEQAKLKPHDKNLKPSDLLNLNIFGTPKGRRRFIAAMIIILTPQTSTAGAKHTQSPLPLPKKEMFVNLLSDLLEDNQIVDEELADNLVSLLGIKRIHLRLQHGQLNIFNIQLSGDSQASEKFITALTLLFEGKRPEPGEAPGNFLDLLNLLLELSVGNGILQASDAANAAATLGIPVTPEGPLDIESRPLTIQDMQKMEIGGTGEARDHFVEAFLHLLNSKLSGRGKITFAARMVLKLVVENEIMDETSTAKLLSYFSYQGVENTTGFPAQTTEATAAAESFTTGVRSSKESNEKDDNSPLEKLEVKGDAKGAKHFLTSLDSYVDNKDGERRTPKDKASALINLLLQLFVDNRFIEKQLAVDMVPVFGVPSQVAFEIAGTPRPSWTPAGVKPASIGGEPDARTRLLALLVILYEQKYLSPDVYPEHHFPKFVLGLLRFGVDNDLFDPKVAKEIANRFDLKYPIAPRPTAIGGITAKLTGDETANRNFMEGILAYSRERSDHPDSIDGTLALIDLLSDFLVENEILDSDVVANLIATFGFTHPAHSNTHPIVLTVSSLEKQPIKGTEQGRAKFVLNLGILLDKRSASGTNRLANLYHFVNALLQLLIDNSLTTSSDADKLCTYFDVLYYPVDVPSPSEHEFSNMNIGGTESEGFVRAVTEYLVDTSPHDIPYGYATLINLLVQFFYKSEILDARTAGDLVATFSHLGVGQSPIKGKYNPIATVQSLKVAGDKKARASFLNSISILLEKKTTSGVEIVALQPQFIKALLQFGIDNQIFEIKDAGKIAIYFGVYFIGVDTTATVSRLTPSGNGRNIAGRLFLDSVSTYLDSAAGLVDRNTKSCAFVNLLLRLLVDDSILDVTTAGSLSATFRCSDTDFSFGGAWEPLTPVACLHSTVSGSMPARMKFLLSVKPLIEQLSNNGEGADRYQIVVKLLNALTQLVLENEIFDSRLLIQVSSDFDIPMDPSTFTARKANEQCCGGYAAALDNLMAHDGSRKYFGVQSKDALASIVSKRLIQAGVIENACMLA